LAQFKKLSGKVKTLRCPWQASSIVLKVIAILTLAQIRNLDKTLPNHFVVNFRRDAWHRFER